MAGRLSSVGHQSARHGARMRTASMIAVAAVLLGAILVVSNWMSLETEVRRPPEDPADVLVDDRLADTVPASGGGLSVPPAGTRRRMRIRGLALAGASSGARSSRLRRPRTHTHDDPFPYPASDRWFHPAALAHLHNGLRLAPDRAFGRRRGRHAGRSACGRFGRDDGHRRHLLSAVKLQPHPAVAGHLGHPQP